MYDFQKRDVTFRFFASATAEEANERTFSVLVRKCERETLGGGIRKTILAMHSGEMSSLEGLDSSDPFWARIGLHRAWLGPEGRTMETMTDTFFKVSNRVIWSRHTSVEGLHAVAPGNVFVITPSLYLQEVKSRWTHPDGWWAIRPGVEPVKIYHPNIALRAMLGDSSVLELYLNDPFKYNQDHQE